MCGKNNITRKQINEGNELIAKFMGYQILFKKYQYENFNSSNESYFQDDEGEIVCDEHGMELNLYPDGDPLFSLSEIPFHEDWNLLMDVVEKIGDTYINGMQLGTEISGSKGYYSCIVFGTHISGENEDPKIAVWNCVVKFIKWYNKENIEGKIK